MKICNTCKQEKEDDKFYTYYHSVQKKYRTRKICKDCTYEQNKNWKLEHKKTYRIEDDPNYKKCVLCKKYLLKSEFTKARTSCCYDCFNEKQREKQKRYMLQKGGSDRVNVYPDHYECEIQKGQVFMIMEAFGWEYNKDNGIWFKEGLKTREGVWTKMPNKPLPEKETLPIDKFQGPKMKRPSKARLILENNKQEILKLRKKGMFYHQIASMFVISETTVRKFVDECYENGSN